MHAAEITALRISLVKAQFENREQHACVPLGFADADACLKGGLQRGALHEVFAETSHEAAATGFTAALARRVCADRHLLWIRQNFSALEFGELAATGLFEFGLNPARILFLHVSDAMEALRAGGDALSCAALGAVVIEIPGNSKILDLVASRRLTLACARNGVTGFLLRFAAKPDASAAETRWLVRAAPSCQVAARATGEDCSPAEDENWGKPAFETRLLRNRHGQTGHWVMEWNCDNGLFREPGDKQAANPGAVVSTPCDRPVATAMEGSALRSVA
jgi:protein ImuA